MNFYLYQFKWLSIATGTGMLILLLFFLLPEGLLYDVSGLTYGQDKVTEKFTDALELSDSSLIMLGYSNEQNNNSVREGYLVKADSQGNQEWMKSFNEESKVEFNSVKEEGSNGFLLAGKITSGSSYKSDAYLLKVDSQGNKEWTKSFGAKDEDSFSSIAKFNDGSYLLAGKVRVAKGEDDFNQQAYLVKVDSSGNQEWSQEFGGDYYDGIKEVKRTLDGGFLLVGYYGVESFSYATSAYIIKLDSSAKEQWIKVIEEKDYNTSINSFIETEEGEFVLVGEAQNKSGGNYGGYILHLTSTGGKKWSKVYYNQEEEDYYQFTGVEKAKEGNFIIVGHKLTPIVEDNTYRHVAYVLKIDNKGNQEWMKNFRSAYNDGGFNSITKTKRGDYLLAGWIQDRYEVDGYLVRIDSTGEEVIFETEEE